MLERISGGGFKPYKGSHGSRSVSKMLKPYHTVAGDAMEEDASLLVWRERAGEEVGPVGGR